MKPNWNFLGGKGVQNKKPSVGGVWIFPGTTQCISQFQLCLSPRALSFLKKKNNASWFHCKLITFDTVKDTDCDHALSSRLLNMRIVSDSTAHQTRCSDTLPHSKLCTLEKTMKFL